MGIFFISFFKQNFLGIPSFFFLQDYRIWVIFEIIERAFLLFGLIFLGYSVYSLIVLEHVKKIIIFFVLISITILMGFIINPPTYFITENGILGWENSPIIASFLNFLFLLMVTIPGTIVFFKNALSAKIKRVKIRGFVMSLTFVWSTMPSVLDFLFVPFFKANPLF